MSKPILCIIPGWDGTKETWKEFCESAREFFDVHCIELPCFGGVECPRGIWGIEQYGEYVYHQVHEIRKNNPERKIILMGHSFGGQVAAYVGEWHSSVFDELVLMGAAIIRPKRIFKRTILGSIAKIGKLLLSSKTHNTRAADIKKSLYRAFYSPDYTETSGVKREIFRKVIREDMRGSLPKITQHVLIFWGKRDTYTPLRHGKKIAKLLTNAEMVVFEDGRHGLHHTHAADILTKLKARYTY